MLSFHLNNKLLIDNILYNCDVDLDSQLLGDDDDVKYFSWDIDNKYYSARVVLCATERLPLRIPVDGIEAVILHYEPKAI